MQRLVVILTAAVVVAGFAALIAFESPPAPNAGAAKPQPAAGTVAVGTPDSTADGAAQAGSAETGTAAAPAARAVSAPPTVSLRRLPGSYDQPVYLTAPPGDTGRLFIVEKTGTIRIVKNGSLLARPFLDISSQVSRGGEQGLLSMAFDPRYATNRRFYVDFTNTAGDTRVVRYRASASDPDVALASSARVLLRVDQPYDNHNGGQLQFGPDGRLWVGMGDGGSGGDPQGRAQNDRSRLGKLLRLNVNVSPVRVAVYAKGLRNPWRFSFDRSTHALWIGDVGQNAWEEIDYLRPGRPAGANFGWNGYEGTHVYNSSVASRLDRSSLTWPVAQYSHSLGYSVTGGYVYRGAAIRSLRGFYLFADWGSGHVWAKKGPGGPRRTVAGLDGKVTQISSFGQDARGELYVVSLAGSVYRIVP
jgi:glucose/arabinose dehydrogenase